VKAVVGIVGGVLLGLVLVAPSAFAQCVFEGCGTAICQGGCSDSLPMRHYAEGLTSAGGRFGFAGTSFESTCWGAGPAGPCGTGTGKLPPGRFWAYNQYMLSNSGCTDLIANAGMVHTVLDLGHSDSSGNWVLFGCNWEEDGGPGPGRMDGCIASTEPVPPDTAQRTVLEVNFADSFSGEGTPDRSSWYLVASVPETEGRYDFDAIEGGNSGGPSGDGPGHVVVRHPPSVRIDGLPGPTPSCPVNDSTMVGLPNPHSAAHFNLDLRVNPAVPTARADWFTEAGRNKDPQLIEGFQVVYKLSSTPPTSSYLWLPARDPDDPVHNVAGLIPWSETPGSATVALPISPGGGKYWLAVRLVYRDATINGQLGPGPIETAPKLVSLPGAMCGPVASPVTLAVKFADVKAEWTDDGALISWTTLEEVDTLGFAVFRSASADGSSGVSQVGSIVMSRGGGQSYSASDGQVRGAEGQPYWYYVQELVDVGYGTRSQWAKLASPDAVSGAGGARERNVRGE